MNVEDRILKNPRELLLKNTVTGEVITFEIQDNPENVEKEGTILNSSFFYEDNNEKYPIGKVEIFYDDKDHSNYLGFQWERCFQGRVLVGINLNDEEFKTIGKKGGSKKHKHLEKIGFDDGCMYFDSNKHTDSIVYSTLRKIFSIGESSDEANGRFSYTDEADSAMPFEVVAFWRRKE